MRYVSISPVLIRNYITQSSNYKLEIEKLAILEGLTDKEINDFLNIQDETTILFNGWIESDSQIRSFLKSEKKQFLFTDTKGFKNHILFKDFQRYVENFLPDFKSNFDVFEDILLFQSYSELVQLSFWKKKEYKVLQDFSLEIENILGIINETKDIKAFNQKACILFTDQIISIINNLSGESSYYKISFIENAILLIKDSRCSANTSGFILKQLNNLRLQDNQKESIEQTLTLYKEGKLTKQKPKKSFNFRLIGTLILLIVICSSVFVFYNQMNSSDLITQKDLSSSLQFFSKAERMKIDSILKEKKISSMVLDSMYQNSGVGFDVSIRIPFSNQKAESIYQKLEKGLSDYYFNPQTPCQSTGSFKKELKNTESLSKSIGAKSIDFKNKSDYTILIIMFDDVSHSMVYSFRLLRGEELKFSTENNMVFFFLPGDKSIDNSLVPFCQIDFNYDKGFSTPYTFLGTEKKSKVLFEGKKGDMVEIVDLGNVFAIR